MALTDIYKWGQKKDAHKFQELKLIMNFRGLTVGDARRHMSCSRAYSTSLRQSTKWKVTVGLEIHAQLKTSIKLFSKSLNRFGTDVNRDLALLDIAIPGVQPVLNRHAVYLAVQAALALGCKINQCSTFDRKHYFYPDQPTGYQITQHYNALAHDGVLEVFQRDGIDEERLNIGISQLQLEQDTARTTYLSDPPMSLVDLNRSGAPLIEIVTTPCIPSAKAAGAVLRKIQAILRTVGASDADMESGGMRCDVNVSVTTDAERHLGPSRRVEIKNLASGKVVKDAVEAEFLRQADVLEAGGTVGKETRGYDIGKRETFLIRNKESATDYRYMPEPDVRPVRLSSAFLQHCLTALPELPDARLDRLLESPYELAIKDARVLLDDGEMMQFYEAVLDIMGRSVGKPRIVSNWIVHELLGKRRSMLHAGKEFHQVSAQQLAGLLQMIYADEINGTAGKVVLQSMLDGDTRSSREIVTEKGLAASQDSGEMSTIVQEVLRRHDKQREQLMAGDLKVRKWFTGQVMREMKGRAKVGEIERQIDSIMI